MNVLAQQFVGTHFPGDGGNEFHERADGSFILKDIPINYSTQKPTRV